MSQIPAASPPRNIVITGASSGIGKALALLYAKRGASLGLIGRNQERLDAVAAQCRQEGANDVETGIIDVRARAELMNWIAAFDRKRPVDLLFANAGVTGGTTATGAFEPNELSFRLVEINVLGVFNSVHAILPAMIERGHGQIALLSSLAGFVPLADSPSYCGSKYAIMGYGLALGDALRPRGLKISVICPGFVETPMANSVASSKPFQISADEAAKRIARGLERGQTIIAFPFALAFGARLGQFLPASVRRWLLPSFHVTAIRAD
jgi:short-subunit dehydrogenase